MNHPSAQHPPQLIDAVCMAIGQPWGPLLRTAMMEAPVWLAWVAIVDHGDTMTAGWFESEKDARRWLKQVADYPGGHPWAKCDIEGRLKRAIKATIEAETEGIDWDAEFQ